MTSRKSPVGACHSRATTIVRSDPQTTARTGGTLARRVVSGFARAPLVARRPIPLLLLFGAILVALGLPGPASAQTRPRAERAVTCPDGSTPLTVGPTDYCFPSDCVSLHPLDWGLGGIPPGVISIDKFDEVMYGSLVQVDVAYKANFVGSVCADNNAQSCGHAALTAWLISNTQANGNNTPPVTNIGPFQVDDQTVLTPTGFYLGSSDGQPDCQGNPVGNPSIGDCAPGEDHYIDNWDEEYGTPVQTITDPADLAAWVKGAGPDVVEFDTDAAGGVIANIGHLVDLFPYAEARVWMEVTYYYCPNAYPECADDAPLNLVCQDDPVGISIDLLQQVTDANGCIDCSTFEIIDQPDFGGDPALNYLLPQFPACSGMGNKDDPIGCSDCTNCTVLYVPKPDQDFCARDSFTLRVWDDSGDPNAFVDCIVFITVNEANQPPIANPDTGYTTCEGVPVIIPVCANDEDPDNNQACGCELQCGSLLASDIEITEQPSCGGTAVGLSGGRVRFDPPAGFCGGDANPCVFKYRLRDQCLQPGPCKEALWSNETTVSVVVYPVNEPPVAWPDEASTCEGMPVTIDVCLNDSDADDVDGCGCPLDCSNLTAADLEITQQPTCGGSAVSLGAGRVRFTPPAGFCGGDLNPCTFMYRIRDNCDPPGPCSSEEWSNETTVSVVVYAVNQAPVAVPDVSSTCAGETVVIPVCSNDTDADNTDGCGCMLVCAGMPAGDLQITQQPSCGGTAVALSGGRIRFDPPADYCDSAPCVIKYRIRDDCSGTEGNCAEAEWSNETTVTVDVYPVNEAPVAVDDEAITSPGSTIIISVCDNDHDPDDSDGCGCLMDCANLTAADLQVTAGSCGTPTPLSGGKVRYEAPSQCTICEFTYRIRDDCSGVDGTCAEEMWSNWATVTVTITGPNVPPVAVDDFATTDEDTPVSICVCNNDSDPNDLDGCGCPLVCSSAQVADIVITRQPDCGGTVVVQAGGCVWFTPPPDYCGPCTFDYKIRDNCPEAVDELWSNEATVTVDILGVNDPPVAIDDEAWTPMDTPVDVDVCLNDYDIDNSDPQGCGCTLDCPNPYVEITWWDSSCAAQKPTVDLLGRVTFTPAPGFIGTCQFGYKIWDSDRGSQCDFAEATVTIYIQDPCIDIDMRRPASLLIYPEFDNREGVISILTVTNTGLDEVEAHFVYRDEHDCDEWNRSAELTPKDTLTLITNYHNPEHDRGYVYVYAQCPGTHDAVVYNYLVGNLMVVDGLETFSFSVNPLDVKGIGIDADGDSIYHESLCPGWKLTDLDGDGLLDLDGKEYDYAMDQILIPRFLGQSEDIRSELILIDLSGGGKFETTIDFQVYNDNEEEFSTEHRFTCWTRVPLLDISGIFAQDFLVQGTNHDPDEILGQNTQESGWMRLDGAVAVSQWLTIDDPAFLAVLVESVVNERWVADLPFYHCHQDNGALLPTTPGGDQD